MYTNIGKLCTEDPISVSIKFSLKFHTFFNRVIRKGKVLGEVDHLYWKKEYQARDVPHYHIILWICGQDDPEQILKWIQAWITCHIPDPKTFRCSAYCRRKAMTTILFHYFSGRQIQTYSLCLNLHLL